MSRRCSIDKFLEYSYSIESNLQCGHHLFHIMELANSSIPGAYMLRLTSDHLTMTVDPDENIFKAASKVRDKDRLLGCHICINPSTLKR